MQLETDRTSLFRLGLIISLGLIGLFCIVWRLWSLHIIDNDFLQIQGAKRSIRSIPVTAFRGMIVDRHGEPLAISTPVQSVWVDPSDVNLSQPGWAHLAALLHRHEGVLKTHVQSKKDKQFLYIKRHISPAMGRAIDALDLNGVYTQVEYKRFYPMGEVFAHVLGRTNIDHAGIQGAELLFQQKLAGKQGRYRVLKDRLGKKVEGFEYEALPKNGEEVVLSLDSRIQYMAYKALKQAVVKHQAKAGIAVVLDVHTGEILAMANQPSYNPNTQLQMVDDRLRNRAVTDTFEPGSVMKAISMISILESGQYYPHSRVDTAPGWIKLSGHIVKDHHNYGMMNLGTILQKSSNVGITKLALSLSANHLVDTYRRMGFGERTMSQLPGELSGVLNDDTTRNQLGLATLAFGYGLTATPLQIAQSYAIIANGGKKLPLSIIKKTNLSLGEQVIAPEIAQAISKMLQLTTQKGGTATRAVVSGYQVAGKTGTVRKVSQQGYSSDEHVSLFAGFVPADRPKVAIVVVIDEPSNGQFYGGEVAAPVFSKIAQGTMRYFNVPQNSAPNGDYILAKN